MELRIGVAMLAGMTREEFVAGKHGTCMSALRQYVTDLAVDNEAGGTLGASAETKGKTTNQKTVVLDPESFGKMNSDQKRKALVNLTKANPSQVTAFLAGEIEHPPGEEKKKEFVKEMTVNGIKFFFIHGTKGGAFSSVKAAPYDREVLVTEGIKTVVPVQPGKGYREMIAPYVATKAPGTGTTKWDPYRCSYCNYYQHSEKRCLQKVAGTPSK